MQLISANMCANICFPSHFQHFCWSLEENSVALPVTGKATAAKTAALPSPTSAYQVFTFSLWRGISKAAKGSLGNFPVSLISNCLRVFDMHGRGHLGLICFQYSSKTFSLVSLPDRKMPDLKTKCISKPGPDLGPKICAKTLGCDGQTIPYEPVCHFARIYSL